MQIEGLVKEARARRAADLHLESGRAAMIRVNGELEPVGEGAVGAWLLDEVKGLLGRAGWEDFLERKSFDLSRNLAGVRCRLNVFKTNRGLAVAVRLLSSFQASLTRLNLHPSMAELVSFKQGLVLFSGPTGCGKSTTMAALIEELNRSRSRHIITIEQPIEYTYRPKRCMIRQREVPTDTPSFKQGLLDSLREDPDVILVGEMRDPETMRLTMNAAETGHLVFATLHSGSVTEALQRLVFAFPPESQPSVLVQLADCLQGVVCQRLSYRESLGFRVAECEILRSTTPIRSVIRSGRLNKIGDAIQTGGPDGMFSFERYRRWLDEKRDWVRPMSAPKPDEALPTETRADQPELRAPSGSSGGRRGRSGADTVKQTVQPDGTIEISGSENLESILAELE